MQERLKKSLEQCSTLPTLPAVAVRILKLCQSDDIDLAEIARAVSTDPALSAKVLKLVNSPAFGLRQEVRTVQHALALLGLNSVRTLALSFSLVRDLRKTREVGLRTYWKRSIIAGVAARELAAAIRLPAGDEAFLAALIQDIGILALDRIAGRDYEKIVAQAGDSHFRLAGLEREAFGSDHAEVGAWLTASWRLPEPLRHAIALSHATAVELAVANLPNDVIKLARIVRLSGLIADIWVREDATEATEWVKREADSTVGLGPTEMEPVLARTALAIPEVAELFDMELGSPEEIGAVLDQASETLVMVTLRASQQMASAQVAIDSLQKQTRVLEEASTRDKLTGLHNRARLDAYLPEQLVACQRAERPLSVILADVDHFKRINDRLGHPAGDKVLMAVAAALGGRLRPRDLAARYGGEEFVLVLPETDAAGALVVAERTRQRIEAVTHDLGESAPHKVTISLGCATFPTHVQGSAADILSAADQALYAAKRGGRNRVVAYSATGST